MISRSKRLTAWLNAWYLLPALAVLLLFWLVPMVLVIIFSLFSWTYGTHPQWAGLSQYHIVLTDPIFWQSLRVTLEFVAGVVLIGSTLSLILAVLLYRGIRGVGLFRSLYFLPYVLPVVATSTIWLWIYQSPVGVLDRFIHALGGSGNIGWLAEPNLALIALIIFTIWFSFGFTLLLFMAGLTNIPGELWEAASVDGANSWQQFFKIIWPLLTPTTLFVVVVNTINAFQSFTQIYALTQGGPLNGTTTLTYYIYETAFKYFNFGPASAAAVIFFVLILMLTGLQFWLTRRSIQYGG
jgi:ABC-type sugar transport system permease subunit